MASDRRNFFKIPVLDKCSISVCNFSNMTCRICPYSIHYKIDWNYLNRAYSSAHVIQHYSFNK